MVGWYSPAFVDASFAGSAAGTATPPDEFVAIQGLPMGNGYRMTTSNGQVGAFGDAPSLGSVLGGNLPLSAPIVGTA